MPMSDTCFSEWTHEQVEPAAPHLQQLRISTTHVCLRALSQHIANLSQKGQDPGNPAITNQRTLMLDRSAKF